MRSLTAGNGHRYSVRFAMEREVGSLLAQLVEAHAVTPSLFRDQPQPIVLYDLHGRIVVGNTAAVRLLGHPAGTLVGSHFSAHLAPNCIGEAHRVAALCAAGVVCDFEAVFVHADGHPVHVNTTLVPARLRDRIVGIYGVVREVQFQREVAEAVEQAGRFRSISLIAASSGRTPEQQIEDSLALGVQLLAVDVGSVMRLRNGELGQTHSAAAIPRESAPAISLDLTSCNALFGSFDVIAVDDVDRPPWNRAAASVTLPWRSYIATKFEIAGNFAGIVVFGADQERGALFSAADQDFVRLISVVVGCAFERQSQQARLDALAFSDTLTGLPNRALLADRLVQLIAESRRNYASFAVHFIDLDGFKHVNDTAGHEDGDAVLRQAAQRLKEALRDSDSVARLGGDEFIILQKHVRGAGEAIALARTLLDLMRLPFVVGAGTHVLSASIGISLFPRDGDCANTLLRHADIALYRAKASGRSRFALYTQSPERVVAESLKQETGYDSAAQVFNPDIHS